MFKQVKSILLWSLLYRFRRRLTLVAVLLSIVLLSQWIYSDIVEYLTLTKKTTYLDYILPLKWIIIFFNIGFSVYLILSIFKVEKEQKSKNIDKEEPEDNPKHTDREKEFMTKKIRTEAEIIMSK